MVAIVTNNIQEYFGYLEEHKLSQKDCIFVNNSRHVVGRRFTHVEFLYHAQYIPQKEMNVIMEYLDSHLEK